MNNNSMQDFMNLYAALTVEELEDIIALYLDAKDTTFRAMESYWNNINVRNVIVADFEELSWKINLATAELIRKSHK